MALSRGIGATLLAEISKPVFRPVLLVDLDWPSGRVRAHTGRGDLTFDGQTWAGIADIATVDLPGDDAGFAVRQGSIRIIGSFDDVIDATEEEVKTRLVTVYYGATTTPGGSVLVGTPFVRFAGFMDGTRFITSDGIYGLELTIASGPNARLSAAIEHSYEDQIDDYPGDTAGRHTALAEANAQKNTWPAS